MSKRNAIRSIAVSLFYAAAIFGIFDAAIQAATYGEIKPIHRALTEVFGARAEAGTNG